jgi:SHS2 domain-containing protein
MAQEKNLLNADSDIGGVEEILHTADVALRIWAIDFGSLMIWAARGLNKLMYDDVLPPPFNIEKRLTIEAFDKESLLVEWLSELAFWAESERILFHEIDILTLTDQRMTVALEGCLVSALKTVVKAVTYHNLKIEPTDSGVEAVVVLDV